MKVKIADLVMDIQNKYPYTQMLCRSYLCDENLPADFTVTASKEDFERDRAACPTFSPGYIESLAICRAISAELIRYNGFILHASVIEKGGEAFAFSAPSGTGKTTHAHLWLDVFPDARIINGDKPFLRFLGDTPTVYGTPWCGKEGDNVNVSAPLKALCFIERSPTNSISPLGSSEALSRLFHQLLLPKDTALLTALLDCVSRFLEVTPLYLLKCNMDKQAAVVAYEGMHRISCGCDS